MTNHLVAHSRFWDRLWQAYGHAPSIAFCRVPEMEYASGLALSGVTLDHCCGDGRFAAMVWPDQRFTAGCDVSPTAIDAAAKAGHHEKLDVCDAGKRLPYADATFDLVFDNSALEHIPDLPTAMREIARVTKIGGRFAMNILNRRYYDWWPLDDAAKREYGETQPIYHLLTVDEWRNVFAENGFELIEVQGYFDRRASRALAYLDCVFSLAYIRNKKSRFVATYLRFSRLVRPVMKVGLGRLRWRTAPDAGAGCFFVARRVA
jgi:SAM-dependent methyltransferase